MTGKLDLQHYKQVFDRAEKDPSVFDTENLEHATSFILLNEKNSGGGSVVWKITAAITVILIVLLFIKMGNTSEAALRYNSRAHEEIGMWVMMIFGAGFLTVLFAALSGMVKRRIAKSRNTLVSYLRNASAQDPDKRALHESLLRQLGA